MMAMTMVMMTMTLMMMRLVNAMTMVVMMMMMLLVIIVLVIQSTGFVIDGHGRMMLLVIIVLVVQATFFFIDGHGRQRQARPRLRPRQRQRLAAAPTVSIRARAISRSSWTSATGGASSQRLSPRAPSYQTVKSKRSQACSSRAKRSLVQTAVELLELRLQLRDTLLQAPRQRRLENPADLQQVSPQAGQAIREPHQPARRP